MKTTGTAKTNEPVTLPTGAATPERADPDFNDTLPGLDGNVPVDPDASEFRDEIQVGGYATAGALRTELEEERRQAEQATLEALEAMRAMDAGDQVKWRISRSGHENDELNGYLETWPNHQMTIERIRDRFGGGTFYAKGFRKGRYISHQTLQISGEAKRKPAGVEGVNQSLPVNSTPAFDLQAFMAAQERRDERRREDERRERQEREERDEKRHAERLQLLLTLGPAAITALGGLFNGQKVDYMPLIAAMKGPDPLVLMTQLQTLQKSNQPDVLGRILPMLIDMAGSKASGGDTGWLDVIKEFAKSAGPAVGGLIEANLKAAQGVAPGMTVTTNIPPSPPPESLPRVAPSSVPPDGLIVVPESVPRRERKRISAHGALPVESRGTVSSRAEGSVTTVAGRSPSGAHPPGGAVEMNPLEMMALMPHLPWLKEQLSRMWVAAQRQKDPEVYAALFLEELPEGVDEKLVGTLLSGDQWYLRLVAVDARLDNPQIYPWFEALRTLLLRSLQVAPSPGAAHGGLQPQPFVSQVAAPATAAAQPKGKAQGEERPTKIPDLYGNVE